MITKAELLMGRDKTFADEYTEEVSNNLDLLQEAVNEFFSEYDGNLSVNSGWRPATVNGMTPGAALHSKHIDGLAVDLNDSEQKLLAYALANLDKAANLNLYFEHPGWTATLRSGKIVGRWLHVQLGGPKSRKRFFAPSAALPADPEAAKIKYDTRWDK